MANQIQNFEGEHPPYGQFLSYVDGELGPKEIAIWQSHLDACWSCRVRVGRIEETITDIIEFDEAIALFRAERPSQNWGNFDSRLNALVQETESQPGFWNFLKRLEQFFAFRWTGKLATAGVAAMLVIVMVYQFVLVPRVSANELLEKAAFARQQELKAASGPVIYQKLKISEREKSAVVEVWSDVERSRNRKTGDQTDVLRDYEAIMLRNGFDLLSPLSPEAFRVWRNHFADKEESISGTTLPDGRDAFELKTVIKQRRDIDDIVEARLVVRESDWHPVSQTMQIKTGGENRIFVISELEFRVVNRNSLAENFFGEDVTLAKDIAPPASPIESPSAAPDMDEPESVPGAVATGALPRATADLEIEVLGLLSQAKADLGEQITVKRENGVLHVRGIVETTTRKNEILSALSPVKANPSISIDIKTYSEAVAAENNKSRQAAKLENVEPKSETAAAESELVRHFGSQEAARRFTSQTVNRSGFAIRHAYALKRLIAQFTTDELRQLSPESRAKWLALVRSHASAFQQETASLRNDLQKVFGGAAGTPGVKPVGGIGDVPRAVNDLVSFATANDRVIRSAMTVSAREVQFSAVRSAGFWQSLAAAEAIAAGLQKVK